MTFEEWFEKDGYSMWNGGTPLRDQYRLVWEASRKGAEEELATTKRKNVTSLPCVTTLDLSAGRVLDAAVEADLHYVVVIGEEQDGTEYFASTKSDGPECLWALERAKLKLLQMVYGGGE